VFKPASIEPNEDVSSGSHFSPSIIEMSFVMRAGGGEEDKDKDLLSRKRAVKKHCLSD
jgi:hypothetical protein